MTSMSAVDFNCLFIGSTLGNCLFKDSPLGKKQSDNYTRESRDLQELQPKQVVRIQPFGHAKTWEKAVVNRRVGTISYEVNTAANVTYTRNRKHLRLTKEEPPQQP